MKHLVNIDLNKNQLLQAVIEVLASAPPSPALGQIYYNSTDTTSYICTNATGPVWLDLGSQDSQNTLGPDGDKGDVIVGGTGTTLTIDIDAVTYAKMQNVVTANTLLGSTSAGGVVTELTKSQILAIINVTEGAQPNVATNIAQGTRTATTVPVTSSTGTNATLAEATVSLAGVLSAAKWAEIVANSLKETNVSTNLSEGVTTNTTVVVNSSDGTNATLLSATTGRAGLLSKALYDNIIVNNAKVSYPGDQNLSGYQLRTEKDQLNGYVGLDGLGKINPLQLPALAISETFVVASEVAQLALTVQEGDIAVRTDENKSYISLNDTNASMADWQELLTPTDAVQTVFGRSGTVTAQSGDYTADQITESGTRVFVTPAEKTAITHSNRAALDLVSGTNTGDEPDASTTVKGIIEIATQTEVNTGTDALRAVTPLTLATVLAGAGKYAANIGNGSLTDILITAATHGLGTSGDFIVQVREVSTGDLVETDVNINSTTGLVTIGFNVAPTTNQYRVVIKA